MKTDVEKLSPTRVKLTVSAPYAELQPYVDAAFKNLSEQVQIPGFRKGKVPTRILEQRVGRPAIMQEAVNEALPELYQQAAAEAELRPLGRPEVEVTEVPGLDGKNEGDLVFTVEQDVRPEFDLPDFSTLTVEIEEPSVDDDAVQVRLDALRERFGTLKGVDRPATSGDFVSLDMKAAIEDEEIESVEGVSYQIGEGNMLEGLDEALEGLSAGESTTFTSKLAGGDRAGEEATISVTAQSVKERELPEADDEFAELASEFDTIDELKADLKAQAEKDATANRVGLARNALLDQLVADLDVPVPDQLVEDEINGHLEGEGKQAGDPHGEEIREDTVQAIKAQLILDAINETREVEVSQDDLMGYLTQLSAQYGVDPNQFISMLAQSGQLEQVFGDARRSKSLDAALADVTVKNSNGDVLDLGLEKSPAVEGEEKAPAKKAPAKKAPAKKAPAKKAPAKAAAEETEAAEAPVEGEEAEKAPAKKPATRRAPAKKAAAADADAAAEKDADAEEKAPAKKPATRRAPAKKAPAKTAAADAAAEGSAEGADAEKAPAKKAPAKRTTTRKAPAKTAAAKAEESAEKAE